MSSTEEAWVPLLLASTCLFEDFLLDVWSSDLSSLRGSRKVIDLHFVHHFSCCKGGFLALYISLLNLEIQIICFLNSYISSLPLPPIVLIFSNAALPFMIVYISSFFYNRRKCIFLLVSFRFFYFLSFLSVNSSCIDSAHLSCWPSCSLNGAWI